MPNSSQLFLRASICFAETLSFTGSPTSVVGTLWSMVASVRSGRRTRRPASRSPSKA